MSLTFRQELYKITFEKICLGAVVGLAALLSMLVIEKYKITSVEKIKDVAVVVAKTEGYFVEIHNFVSELEKLDRLRSLVDISIRFKGAAQEKELKQITELEKSVKKVEDIIYKKLKNDTYNLGAEIQGHLIIYLSENSQLYDAKESFRQGARNKQEWQIKNSLQVIEEAQNRIRNMKLTRFNIRDFALEKAAP